MIMKGDSLWFRSKYVVKIISLMLVLICLTGCSSENAGGKLVSKRSIEYGIGTAALSDTIGKEWEATQDGPAYSDGKVSAQVDSSNQITKVFAYFSEDDMANDYVLYFAGEAYPSIESITAKFGEFDTDSSIEYSDEEAILHVEITNKDKNEYYMSVKEASISL